MSKIHGKNTVVLIDEFDLSSFFNQMDTSVEVSTGETTCFGATGSARVFVTGLLGATVSLSGYFDGATGAEDESISADLAAAATRVVTCGMSGTAIGDACKMLAADYTSYATSSPLDGPVTTSLSCQANGGLLSGRFLHALAATTGDANGASVDGAAASTAGWTAHLHITTVSGTSPTLDEKLQDSADDSSWLDVSGGAFAQKTAAGSERITGTGTLRRYVRAVRDIGGTDTPTFTFSVAVARRNIA